MNLRRVLWMSAWLAVAWTGLARATPSTVFWAPSTPYLQPFGKLHVTYDTYFDGTAAYPIDTGLTIGALPWQSLQLEVGFDLVYPTYSGGEPLDFPILVNAKLGAPEGLYVYFTPDVDLLTGPVFFFDPDLQPGGSSWMWSMQLDADIDFSP